MVDRRRNRRRYGYSTSRTKRRGSLTSRNRWHKTAAGRSEVEVTKIVDGDTVEVQFKRHHNVRRVRLHGIMSPELTDPRGDAAKAHLMELLSDHLDGESLYLENYRQLSWGRVVGTLYWKLEGPHSVNYRMVEDGYAKRDERYDNSEEYTKAEKTAKLGKRGLWKDDPTPDSWGR